MIPKRLLAAMAICAVVSCTKSFDKEANFSARSSEDNAMVTEDPSSFTEIGSIDLGEETAGEISAYDANTKKLFSVDNVDYPKIDVVDLSNPSAPKFVTSIDVSSYGGAINSVVAKNGYLAAAIQADDKVSAGKAVIFNTTDYTVIKEVTVGSQPDMITVSANGKFILTANEGEPNSYNQAGSIDPVGSVSIITVPDFAVTTIDFSSFAGKADKLKAKGFRIFGPNASFAQDIEPEYITISEDSKTAWVTLQENNGIGKVDLVSKTITDIFPLGFKNFNQPQNAIDPNDENGVYTPGTWPVRGIYMPDAIRVLTNQNVPYLFTANEGDARDYDGFSEEVRVGDDEYILDPTAFANPENLKRDNRLGRLTVTNTLGDVDNDGDFDKIYTFGARSFSVWNGLDGKLVYDCGNELEQKTAAAGLYDDGRSDNKGVEPEGIELGKVDNTQLLFVGMERADAVAIYKLKSNETAPVYSQILQTGDAPEGLLFVHKDDSPTNRSLLIVSSEGDGVIKIFAPKKS